MSAADSAELDRNLALEMVRVTEASALSVSRLMGRGDEQAADRAAAQAMRAALNRMSFNGFIVIGEGQQDETDLLYSGEAVGDGTGPRIDIALDPLEGNTIAAKGGDNALSVVALSSEGGFLNVPDIYMEKIAIGPGLPEGVIDLDEEPGTNLIELTKAKGVDINDLVVCILDRPRHHEMIARVRESGARIRLIEDGDVSAAIAAARDNSGIDVYMGIGGAPQGILSAAAIRSLGGQMQGRLVFRTDDEKESARRVGFADLNYKYSLHEMARGDVMIAATGVTDGAFLDGVRRHANGAVTHSLVMRSKTRTLRYVEAHHDFTQKMDSFPAP
ncbi:MAG: class II fructose-bisphosphatase [Rhodospirillales bacterium]|nr:class II fructose-bisphosphatase [Rhodospirillales bacterium]